MENFTKYARELMNENVFIHTSVGYVAKNEDYWNMHLNNKTYQIYVHSLAFLSYLSKEYDRTKNEIYLIEGEKLLFKWINNKHQSKFIMHEQPVSARVNNILLFSQYQYPNAIPENITMIIEEHINFLLDNKNYKKNNHGIMMDTALSRTLKYIPNQLKYLEKPIINTVVKRSKEAIDRDFSSQHLHLENSPDYHRLTIRWLFSIEENLNKAQYSLGKVYIEKLKNASSLEGIIAMPNLRYPINGDSSDGTFKGIKNYDDFIDNEAGRAVLQNENNKSQLTFISGYGSKGHKHYDDLSVIFYDGNQVLLNDSGKYNYVKNDSIRKHMISPLAHNSLSIYQENYTLSNSNKDQKEIFIDKYFIGVNYKLIKGINNSYTDTTLIRFVIILDDDTLIFYDKFDSQNQQTIAVNFNLGLSVTAEKLSRGKFLIEGTEKYILQSHYGKYTSVILNDSEVTPCKISNRFNEFESNERILYRQKTKQGFFVTTLSKEKNKIEILDFDDKHLVMNNNNKKYNISFE